jgi:hypothetical protein
MRLKNNQGGSRPDLVFFAIFCTAIRQNHAYSRGFFSRRERGERRETPRKEIGN